LSFGVRTNLQLALTDLGLSDRILVWAFSEWLQANNLASNDPAILREVIGQNAVSIIDGLSPQIPFISQNNLTAFVTRIRLNMTG